MKTATKPKAARKLNMPDPAEFAVLPPGTATLLSAGQVCAALNISPRKFSAMLATGEYPPHDCPVGAQHRWARETHDNWVKAQIAKAKGKGG